MHLTVAQDGAYRRLIDHYMVTRQPIPDNDHAIARIIGMGTSDWLAIAEPVRAMFKITAGRLHLKRCDNELRWQEHQSRARSNAGKKGGQKSAEKRKTYQAVLEQPSSFAQADKIREDKKEINLSDGEGGMGGDISGAPDGAPPPPLTLFDANGSGQPLNGHATPAKPKRQPRTKAPMTAWPEGFALTQEMAAYSRQHLPSRSPKDVFEEFRTKAAAKEWQYARWPQAFQNFVMNEKKWNRGAGR